MPSQTDAAHLIAACRQQGFTVDLPRRKGRATITSPAGDTVVMPGPGQRTSARALLNARAALRRIGAQI